MKLKEGFKMRKLGREYIITAEGKATVNFNKMIALNTTAADLWTAFQGKEFDAEQMADYIIEQYEIDRETALTDSLKLCRNWLEAGIAEE